MISAILGICLNLYLFALDLTFLKSIIFYIIIIALILDFKLNEYEKERKEYQKWLNNINAGKPHHE